eukprot:2721305-Pleurochrysis_carterae.AAC.1
MTQFSMRRGKLGNSAIQKSCHARLGHFSIDRINVSVKHIRGIKKHLRHTHPNCRACMIGGARKQSTKQPISRQFSYYGKCIASDLCGMPTSLPLISASATCCASTTWQPSTL